MLEQGAAPTLRPETIDFQNPDAAMEHLEANRFDCVPDSGQPTGQLMRQSEFVAYANETSNSCAVAELEPQAAPAALDELQNCSDRPNGCELLAADETVAAADCTGRFAHAEGAEEAAEDAPLTGAHLANDGDELPKDSCAAAADDESDEK